MKPRDPFSYCALLAAGVLCGVVPSLGAAEVPGAPLSGQPPAAAIAGGVFDAAGRPVQGALVVAVDVGSWAIVSTARSAQDGVFHLSELKPRRYVVTATAADHPAARHGPVDLSPGETLGSVELHMFGSGFTVSGVVRAIRGQSVEGVHVYAQRWGGEEGDLYVTETGDGGDFRVVLSGRRYHGLWARAPDGQSSPSYVTGERDESLVLELEPVHPEGTPPPPAVGEWLRKEAIALKTVDAGSGLADMKPLATVIGDARVVGLGEATHGTSEFFRLKHRVLEFLAREMGFRLFAIEANLADALVVDEYVGGGEGNPDRLVARLGFPWDTREIRDLIVWMRHYNRGADAADRVRFLGFDIRAVTASARALDSYVDALEPERAEIGPPSLAALIEADDMPLERIDAAVAALDALERVMNERRARNETASSPSGSSMARHHARVVRQNLERRRADLSPGHGRIRVRDRSMAENVMALLGMGGSDARMVIWAHNAHVSRDSLPSGIRSMGSYLAERLERRYVAVGMSFDRGHLRAIGRRSGEVDSFEVGAAPVGSLDSTLASLGRPILAIDLRRAPGEGPVRDWIESRLLTRHVGASFNEEDPRIHLITRIPLRHFDALLFVAETSAARTWSRRSTGL